MEVSKFIELRQRVIDAGFGDEIIWQEELKPCETFYNFLQEYVWVVLSSGISNTAARTMERKYWGEKVINHPGKCKAITEVTFNIGKYWRSYQEAEDKLGFIATMPYMGPALRFHFAKNLGIDAVKPDRHLIRIAGEEAKTPFELCNELAKATGYRLSTVDIILWRAANLRMI